MTAYEIAEELAPMLDCHARTVAAAILYAENAHRSLEDRYSMDEVLQVAGELQKRAANDVKMGR